MTPRNRGPGRRDPGCGAGQPRRPRRRASCGSTAPRPDQLVVEIRAKDRAGLLAVLTGVFERAGVDIVWAKVTTLGSSVVDVFCIAVPPLVGTDVKGLRDRLERELYAVLPAPPPPSRWWRPADTRDPGEQIGLARV